MNKVLSHITSNSTIGLTACSIQQQIKYLNTALLVLFEGNLPVTVGFPSQRAKSSADTVLSTKSCMPCQQYRKHCDIIMEMIHYQPLFSSRCESPAWYRYWWRWDDLLGSGMCSVFGAGLCDCYITVLQVGETTQGLLDYRRQHGEGYTVNAANIDQLGKVTQELRHYRITFWQIDTL